MTHAPSENRSPAASPDHVFGQGSYQIAEHLASAIGPRPAASAGERRALAYGEQLLSASGAETDRFPVDNISAPRARRWLLVTLLAGLLPVAFFFPRVPVAALLYWPFVLLVPRVVRAWGKRATTAPAGKSYNLLADHSPRSESRGLLIIGAHIDTATARKIRGSLLPRLQRALRPIPRFLVLVLALLALLKLATDWLSPLPAAVWAVVSWGSLTLATVLLAFHVLYLLRSRQLALAPGANDNGSSVGVVLTAADHFASPEHRPRHLTLRYALWTAEERGLIGSKRYAKETPLDAGSTWVLNLDMVGTGASLSYVRGVGIIPYRPTSRVLNELLRRVQPSIQSVFYFARGSDFKPFLLRSIPAASLTGKGGRRNWYYHTTEDVSQHLQPELMDQAARAVIGVARELDEVLARRPSVGTAGSAGKSQGAS